jgi:hypothetical protein
VSMISVHSLSPDHFGARSCRDASCEMFGL